MEVTQMTQKDYDEFSKFANEIDAAVLDASSNTVTREFMSAVIIAQPVAPLEEEGVITVKQIGEHTDKVIFTVIPESSFTWVEVDARGAEVSTTQAYSAMTAPAYATSTPTTKSAIIFIHDNISLVNPVQFKEIAQVAANQIVQKKITDALTELTTDGNYTAATSIFNCGGYTTKGAVASDDTLTPADLVAAKKSLKTGQFINPDVVLVHTEQLSDIESHADFSPGQTSNANFKKARWDENGKLAFFDGMKIIECVEMPAKTTGNFVSNNGHNVIIGKRGLMAGRGENPRKYKVEDFRNPSYHGTERTMDICYDYVLIYPDGVRCLQAAD